MKNRNTVTMLATGLLACFGLAPEMQAAPQKAPSAPDVPANLHHQVLPLPANAEKAPGSPETVLAGFNTADGDHALFSVTTGVANSAVGWYSLFADTSGSFNTGLGAATLALNVDGVENTAVGTAAMLFNQSGSNNTAVGVLALENGTATNGATAVGLQALQNDTVGSNTAVGFNALVANTTGFNNAAFGVRPLESNVDGTNNTAIGNLALSSSVSTSDHVCVGRHAGDGITIANNNVIIGHLSGVHSVFGQVSDRCFIDNIFGAPVSAATAAFVLIDSDGRLGTFTVADGPDPGGFSPQRVQPQAIPDAAKQAMLNRKVEELEATVARADEAQLKEQAAQIQKVSAQVELNRSA